MNYQINKPKDKWVTYTLNGVDYEMGPMACSKTGHTALTEERALQRASDIEKWNSKSAERKLKEIKVERLRRLQETDYLSNSDMTMPESISTWRQSLRDIPQNNTTEEEYDTLLERNVNEKGRNVGLKHAIWVKPE